MEEMKRCTKCGETRPSYQFYTRIRDGLSSWCRFCCKARAKAAYVADPTYQKRMRATNVVWRANNAEWRKFRHILNSYGLTLDQYYSMEESQDFVCAICGSSSPLNVDHNHGTNEVRGLLCGPCNMGLGNFRDNSEYLQSACMYLDKRGTYAPNFDIGGGA